jgi:hypothetical protein
MVGQPLKGVQDAGVVVHHTIGVCGGGEEGIREPLADAGSEAAAHTKHPLSWLDTKWWLHNLNRCSEFHFPNTFFRCPEFLFPHIYEGSHWSRSHLFLIS